MRTFGISAPSKSAISEVELNRLLDAVRKAIETDRPATLLQSRVVANDNGLEWPFIPFPEDLSQFVD
jgi:hypothetical protein